ncbi:hypothetical protein WA026_015443 [Henosepilachna vigintioctopunctata]|uniref:Uncharacterized protein n=1 Tax=Henosepilachna vigintioctopunctata TaxID=420089 RepID=A0AAW1ULA5_9CUCU
MDCKKTENVQPKCVNCCKNHPANYRGCITAKELQKVRTNAGNRKEIAIQPTRGEKQALAVRKIHSKLNRTETFKIRTPNKSYSQVAAGDISNNNEENISQQKAELTLQLILKQMLEQKQLFQNFDERLFLNKKNG